MPEQRHSTIEDIPRKRPQISTLGWQDKHRTRGIKSKPAHLWLRNPTNRTRWQFHLAFRTVESARGRRRKEEEEKERRRTARKTKVPASTLNAPPLVFIIDDHENGSRKWSDPPPAFYNLSSSATRKSNIPGQNECLLEFHWTRNYHHPPMFVSRVWSSSVPCPAVTSIHLSLVANKRQKSLSLFVPRFVWISCVNDGPVTPWKLGRHWKWIEMANNGGVETRRRGCKFGGEATRVVFVPRVHFQPEGRNTIPTARRSRGTLEPSPWATPVSREAPSIWLIYPSLLRFGSFDFSAGGLYSVIRAANRAR